MPDTDRLFNKAQGDDLIAAIQAITARLQEMYTVDDALSSTSEHPVQNKVVKEALDSKADESDLADKADKSDISSTQTATGNPLTLTDCAPINAESLVVELEPKQDLHGYDFPWVGGAGKNLLPMTVDGIKAANTSGGTWSGNVYSINNGTFTILTDDGGNVTGIMVNGTFSTGTDFFLGADIVADNYIINGCPANGSDSTYYIAVYANGTWANREYGNGNAVNGAISDAAISVVAGVPLSNKVFYPMIRLSTESDATFAPYSNICPITGYTQTSVEGTGINQWDEETAEGWWQNGNFVYYQNSVACKNKIPIRPNIPIYIVKPQSANLYYTFYDKNKVFLQLSGSDNNGRITLTSSGIVTVPENAHYMTFDMGSGYGGIYNHDVSINYPSTDHDYHAYQPTSATIQFGQTVYGADVDFEGGTDSTHAVTTIAEMAAGSHITRETASGRVRYVITIAGMKKQTVRTMADLYSEQYVTISDGRSYANCPDSCIFNRPEGGVFVNDQRYESVSDFVAANGDMKICYPLETANTLSTPPTPLKLLKGTNNLSADGVMQIGYQPDNVIGDVKGEIEDATPYSGTATVTLLHEEDQGEDWIVGFTGEINGHFDPDHFDYYLTARYTHAYNANTQILNMNNCSDGDYVQIWQTGTLDFSVDGGVTVTISVTSTKLTFTVNCIGDSIFGLYSASETTGQVKYMIIPARRGG